MSKKKKEIERHYMDKMTRKTKLKDYPKVDDDSVAFPADQYIAYAVCNKKCGRAEFIVDGGTQVCAYCGKVMFRTVVKRYKLFASDDGDAVAKMNGEDK